MKKYKLIVLPINKYSEFFHANSRVGTIIKEEAIMEAGFEHFLTPDDNMYVPDIPFWRFIKDNVI